MAGQTGNNAHIAAPTQYLPPAMESLLDTPGNYAFVQAIDIATRFARDRGLSVGRELFRFRVNPNLTFPPSDIESLELVQTPDGNVRFDLMLNLMGLHGAASPIPEYFSEYVSKHQDDPDALRDFFDIFNHRLITLLHSVWLKYRYYAQYIPKAQDKFSTRFFGFIGVGHEKIRQAKSLNWPRLMAYMGLIAFNGEAQGSLESILRHYFGHRHITIIPCIPRWIPVPADQRTLLGGNNSMLGEDFVLGEEMSDQTGKFRICIAALSWDNFISFLPCTEKFIELQTLVQFILRSRLDFDVELRLLPEEIRPWRLGDDAMLGWTTWTGDDGDGVIILETDHREL